jgi:hypothetical protein
MPNFFTRDVQVYDGDAAYDTSAEVATILQANTGTGVFAKIWQKTVPAQQRWHWGYGNSATQRNQGYMWFAAADLGTDIEDGSLRLVQANSNETTKLVVGEFNTSLLHTVTNTSLATLQPTSIDFMRPLPEQSGFPWVGEDSKMILEFKTLSAGTTVDGVGFSIPVTIWQ